MVLGLHLDSDVSPLQLFRGDGCGAGSCKRVEDDVAGGRVHRDERQQRLDGFLRRMQDVAGGLMLDSRVVIGQV